MKRECRLRLLERMTGPVRRMGNAETSFPFVIWKSFLWIHGYLIRARSCEFVDRSASLSHANDPLINTKRHKTRSIRGEFNHQLEQPVTRRNQSMPPRCKGLALPLV